MHKFILILVCCFFYAAASPAQNKKYVYEDSTLNQVEPPQEEVITTVEEKPYEQVVKDEDDDKTDTTLIFRKLNIPADSIDSWKNAKAFGYAKNLDSLLMAMKKQEKEIRYTPSESKGPSFFDKLFASSLTRIIFWILAGLFVAFIIYRLFLADGIFKRTPGSKENVAPVVEEEVITPESDFDAFIRSALAGRNYRLAVRYQYLKTLHQLAAKGWVQLAADKTNYQYVKEIKNYDYQNGFSKLTLNYEYVWYGEFAIEEFIYQRLQNDFTDFNKKI